MAWYQVFAVSRANEANESRTNDLKQRKERERDRSERISRAACRLNKPHPGSIRAETSKNHGFQDDGYEDFNTFERPETLLF